MGADEFFMEGPVVGIDPESFVITAKFAEHVYNEKLTIANVGTEELMYEALPGNESWLTLAGELAGALEPWSGVSIDLEFDITGMEVGDYADTITVTSNDPYRSSITIPVELSIRTPGVKRVPDQYSSIQDAVDAAIPEDTILVAAGTYAGSGNRNIDFSGKILLLTSEDGPVATVIDCEHAGRGFIFVSGEGPTSQVESFTIMDGSSSSYGGGIYCRGSSPAILNCLVSECRADQSGGGIFCGDASDAILASCIISGNLSDTGGGISCDNSNTTVANCTLVENIAGISGGGLYCTGSSSPLITNCILWSNAPDEIHVESGDPVVAFSDVFGGWPGEGNIVSDPLFTDPATGDFHLTVKSPCIDAGTYTGDITDIDGETRPNGYRFDIGADEYYPSGGLEVFILEFADTVAVGEALEYKAGIYNTGSEPLNFDEASFRVTGPSEKEVFFYSGLPLQVKPGEFIQTIQYATVSECAPLGTYIFTVNAYGQGTRLSSAAFYLEVVPGP